MVMEGRTGDDETTCDLKQKNVFYREEGSVSTFIPERFYRGSSIFMSWLYSRSESMWE